MPDDDWQRHGPGPERGTEPYGGPGVSGRAPYDDRDARPYTHDPYQGRPGGHTQGYAPQQPTEARTNVFAVVSLVASVLGIIAALPLLGSVIGIVLAVIARKEIAADPSQGGKALADWGLILGVVGLVFWFLMALLMALLVPAFGGFWGRGPWWM